MGLKISSESLNWFPVAMILIEICETWLIENNSTIYICLFGNIDVHNMQKKITCFEINKFKLENQNLTRKTQICVPKIFYSLAAID
jgi:hypothetical protein